MKSKLLLLSICVFLSFNIKAREGAGHVGGTDQPLSKLEQIQDAFFAVLKDIRSESNSNHPFNVILQEMYKEGRAKDADFFSSGLTPYDPEADYAEERIHEIVEELKHYNHDSLNPKVIELSKELLKLQEIIRKNLNLTLNNDVFYADDRFIFHDENPCLQVNSEDDHSTRIARVTELNIHGKICISLKAFKVIAPYDLKNHILGVLIHETAHLSGMNEKNAEKVEALYHEFSYKIYKKDPMTSIHFEAQMATLLANSLAQLYWTNKLIERSIESSNWESNVEIMQKVSTSFGMLQGFLQMLPKDFVLETFRLTFEKDADLLYSKLNKLTQGIKYQMQFFGMNDNQEKIMISEIINAQMNGVIDIAIKCFPSHEFVFEQSRIEKK